MIPGIRRFDPFRISTRDFGADGSFHSVDLANKLAILRGCAKSLKSVETLKLAKKQSWLRLNRDETTRRMNN